VRSVANEESSWSSNILTSFVECQPAHPACKILPQQSQQVSFRAFEEPILKKDGRPVIG